jgi:hypothetical protein
VVLEVTAKTDQGSVIPVGRKEYYEIGYDLDGRQRMGSWQIKEIVDLSLQPRKKTEERFIKELPEGTRSAEVGVKVALWPSPNIELVVDRVMKKISFEK